MNGGVCIAHFNPDARFFFFGKKFNWFSIFFCILVNLYLVFIHPEEIPFKYWRNLITFAYENKFDSCICDGDSYANWIWTIS